MDEEGTPAVTDQDQEHLPPMARAWLLPLYDPLTRVLGVGSLHRRLLEQADVRPGHRVLEIGCGTGNLALRTKAAQPTASVVGLDPDRPALTLARRKSRRRRLDVQWDHGYADALPYPDASIDRVLSSLMLHHVPADTQVRALREVRRVLRPGGELHLLDLVRPHTGRLRHARRHAPQQLHPDLGSLLRDAGFTAVAETGRQTRRFGPIASYRATR